MTKIENETNINILEENFMQFKYKLGITKTNYAQYGVHDIFEDLNLIKIIRNI